MLGTTGRSHRYDASSLLQQAPRSQAKPGPSDNRDGVHAKDLSRTAILLRFPRFLRRFLFQGVSAKRQQCQDKQYSSQEVRWPGSAVIQWAASMDKDHQPEKREVKLVEQRWIQENMPTEPRDKHRRTDEDKTG
ncbi:hypothetical protein G5714_001504 [Onychostoma macrolepis]|uniref:Uncharacterized protein n=1 Tax=Onychostoma macrolepis TaxID=369639 RepID=A0A7J6DCU1_9TELE|nr:hypothetical protein G5714_001504 [Onychostoma macrolepis]